MKKLFLITLVVLFAWSIPGQAQVFDPYVLLKSSSAIDTVIGPNAETDPIYFPFMDKNSGILFDSVLVVVTYSDIANIDSIRIAFDYSPDNTNWIATYADSVYIGKAAATVWVTAKPANTGRVFNNLPFPRYGRFLLWGTMNTGSTDSTSIDSWKIYGYHKPSTINIIR